MVLDKTTFDEKVLLLEKIKDNTCKKYKYIPEKFKKDKDIVLELMRYNGSQYSVIDKSLKNDEDIALMALK